MSNIPDSLREALKQRKENDEADPVSEAAMDVVALEQRREENAITAQEDREQRIAESYELAGRIQAFSFVEKVATVASLVQLKQVKDSKVYRDLPGIATWDNYCEYIGLSRRKVDEDLQNLALFGEQFLATVASFSLGYRELRKLRKLSEEGALQVTDTEVVIGDERIPWSAEYKEDIQDALERLIEAKDQAMQDKDAVIRANKKVIESKQELIQRQEKELARYEQEAAVAGPDAREQLYIQQCENARITIEGFLNQFDPQYNPLPEDATPRMQAALMQTLAWFRRCVHASYDTAAELYGDPEIDGGGWVPPNLRAGEE